VDGFSYGEIAELANGARGADPEGYRAEFVRLVRMAETLGAVAQR
jgi:Ca-activated chloride channel family protein